MKTKNPITSMISGVFHIAIQAFTILNNKANIILHKQKQCTQVTHVWVYCRVQPLNLYTKKLKSKTVQMIDKNGYLTKIVELQWLV